MTCADTATAQDILQFWFTDTAPAPWWHVDAVFGALPAQRLGVWRRLLNH